MPMNKPGGRLRVTDEDTIALVRRLAQHYDDQAIAAILAKQRRRTATALAFTRARVATLRAEHAIPVYQPPAQHDVGSLGDDADVVTITEAERRLGVSKATLYRGSVKALSPPNKSPLARPGASASTRPCMTASSPRHPRAGSASTRPQKPSASPDKPCCTKSNGANCKPSTEDAAKACASRRNPISIDCSTHPDR